PHSSALSVFWPGPHGAAGTKGAPNIGTTNDVQVHNYNCSTSTLDSYEIIIRRHVTPALGHIALQDLRPEHLQRYYNEKGQQGLAASTIKLHHKIVSHALAQAEKNQLILRNVCRLTELPRQPRKEMRTLTIAQVTTQLL